MRCDNLNLNQTCVCVCVYQEAKCDSRGRLRHSSRDRWAGSKYILLNRNVVCVVVVWNCCGDSCPVEVPCALTFFHKPACRWHWHWLCCTSFSGITLVIPPLSLSRLRASTQATKSATVSTFCAPNIWFSLFSCVVRDAHPPTCAAALRCHHCTPIAGSTWSIRKSDLRSPRSVAHESCRYQ